MRFLLLLLFVVPLLACAEVSPDKGELDPRVRTVDYNPQQVVRLSTFYGVSTHVEFSKAETIVDVAIGDDQAWVVAPRGNHLYIKPRAQKADTNVTVVTDKRTYQFALVVRPRPPRDSTAWADPNLIYSLSFRYPEEDTEASASRVRREEERKSAADLRERLSDAAKRGGKQNLDYWVAGSQEVSPTAARDDGRFIYLTFSNNRDMPAVYAVDSEGNEALINTNVIDGNVLVIQRLVPKLMLRKGKLVASVVNKAFDINGGADNRTGTVSPTVQRVLREDHP